MPSVTACFLKTLSDNYKTKNSGMSKRKARKKQRHEGTQVREARERVTHVEK